jgi:hypothetical protein
MKAMFAFLLIGVVAGLCIWFWVLYRRWSERERNSEERFASVMVQAVSSAKAPPASEATALSQQKLLYEAAAKAGEAGEAVLSIQLYARLISRYPDSALGAQARAAVEAQKKKLAKR